MKDFIALLSKANKIYQKNFDNQTIFERAIFFSWFCGLGDCKYCYMSTQTKKIKDPEKARRSMASLIAEAILCKKFKWDISFLAGGYRAYELKGFYNLAKNISKAIQDKLWLNIGALSKEELIKYQDISKGVCAAIEVINPKIRKKVCPSKPYKQMTEMLRNADDLGYEKAITIILGLGETFEDFYLLEEFVKDYKINKISFYALNPQKGTIYEEQSSPSSIYQARWIAQTRISFPKIKILAGIWSYRVNVLGLQLLAGANYFSKFPAIKLFNSKESIMIEEECKSAGRILKSQLNGKININISQEVKKLDISQTLKKEVKNKLEGYIKKMKK